MEQEIDLRLIVGLMIIGTIGLFIALSKLMDIVHRKYGEL